MGDFLFHARARLPDCLELDKGGWLAALRHERLTIASRDRGWGGSGKESRFWRVETRARLGLCRELVLVDQPAEQVTAA
jgi:hypothetical protein